MANLVVGNLDCELAWAGARRPLPAPVADLASAAATLLAAFADDGDRLWTLRPVDPERIARVPELPRVALESGPLARVRPGGRVLAWGETREVAALRRGPPAAASPRSPIGARLWAIAPPAPEVCARANHRRLSFALARARGDALPGSRIVASVAELEAHLGRGGAAAGARGAWVVKAPQSAASRERLRRRGGLDRESRVRAERLLAAHGELVFEPWVDRIEDIGTCGIVAADGRVELWPPHRLVTDRQGMFRGIALLDRTPNGGGDWLDPDVREAVGDAARAAGEAIAADGYRGAFEVDAFRYRDAEGAARVHPLCEINARVSFGHVARALGERVAAARGHSPGRAALQVTGAIPESEDVVPLLWPGGRDGIAAYLVTGSGYGASG